VFLSLEFFCNFFFGARFTCSFSSTRISDWLERTCLRRLIIMWSRISNLNSASFIYKHFQWFAVILICFRLHNVDIFQSFIVLLNVCLFAAAAASGGLAARKWTICNDNSQLNLFSRLAAGHERHGASTAAGRWVTWHRRSTPTLKTIYDHPAPLISPLTGEERLILVGVSAIVFLSFVLV